MASILDQNLRAMGLISRLLQLERPLFTPREVADFARDCGLDRHTAFCMLLAAACGLTIEENADHRRLAREYLFPALRCLTPAAYATDPYYSLLKAANVRQGGWWLTQHTYAPYQVFPCGNTRQLPGGRTIPQLGYFEMPFPYPVLLENGREWMSVIPNEIETMRADIDAARGRTLVLGLGLGYFAYSVSEKPQVRSVTVVERSPEAIALFRDHLLPLFPQREKLTLVQADAFDFIENAADPAAYDYVYADLWHDVSDGVPLYLCLKGLQGRLRAEWRYWIEPDMRIFLQGMAQDGLLP